MIQGEKNISRSRAQTAILWASRIFDIPPREILGKTRSPDACHARQAAYLHMWAHGMSMPQIGHAMGRDHSTVHHGVHEAAKRILSNGTPHEPGGPI